MKTSIKLILGLAGILSLSYFCLRPNETDDTARIMFAEAGNQPRATRRLIGKTITNRKESGKYGNNIRKVIYQDNAFSSIGGTQWRKTILPAWFGYEGGMTSSDRRVYRECLEDATRIISRESFGISREDKVEAFHDTSIRKPSSNYWKTLKPVTQNGKMIFYGR